MEAYTKGHFPDLSESDVVLIGVPESSGTHTTGIADSLTKVQNENQDVEIGSYPFFQAGKLGVSIVIRSEDQSRIDSCNSQILKFVNERNIDVVDR